MKISITLTVEPASGHAVAFILHTLADRLEPQVLLKPGETRALLDINGDRAGEFKTE